ncbi:hypothetical protein DY000_02006838 [Brassica cretica]|uniref:Uncharacterized protein n=1 Tax=Brassica cretica TaxID=69181 RepID=A0ABQ7BZ19_BRACR|nr:hypothetical protein DY000_02006838 [Brassica cretica]
MEHNQNQPQQEDVYGADIHGYNAQGEHATESTEVDGLEGQQEMCFINANGTSQQNPEEYCNVILYTYASEIELNDHEKKVDEAATEIVAKAEVHIVEKADDKVVERVEIQAVKKVEEKVVKRVGHKAETSINENTGQKLKEVELEETPKVEQPPYDKLSFPGRFITKAPNKVIAKFRTYMSDVGVKLPEITNMHDAYRSELAVKPRSREKWRCSGVS